jgi:fucose-1-phosphate guanylyltransferase
VTALVLPNSTFYHIGTLKELLFHFCDPESTFQAHFGIDQLATKCKLTNSSNRLSPQTRIVRSCLTGPTITRSKTLIEFSHFTSSIDVVEDTVISGCHYDRPLSLTIPLFITTIPVQSNLGLRFVTVAFHVRDDLKKIAQKSAIIWLDRPLSQSSAVQQNESEAYSLWNLPLFPVAASMTESFKATMDLVENVTTGNRSNTQEYENWMSMADAIKAKDVTQLLNYRTRLGALIDDQN